jgi:hypothetical protein
MARTENKNFTEKKNIFDLLYQIFEDIKGEKYNNRGWNLPVEEIQGVTFRLMSDGKLQITYHRYEVCDMEGLVRKKPDGVKFVEEITRELKSRFKKLTKKTLKLKKENESQDIDKQSRMQADSSWLLGSSRYGYGARPVARFLIKDAVTYSFDVDLLQ